MDTNKTTGGFSDGFLLGALLVFALMWMYWGDVGNVKRLMKLGY